jgi:hypothetical protein
MDTEKPGGSKVMLRMAIGILAALFVLLGWSVAGQVQPEEFYAAFGTILLVVFLREVVISGVRLLTRANDYYLKTIGHFFVHRIVRAVKTGAGIQDLFVSLQNRFFKNISTMRRQLCRRIPVSGLFVRIDPTSPPPPIKLLPTRFYPKRNAVAFTTSPLKKHSNRVYPYGVLCFSSICSTKFPINGLT